MIEYTVDGNECVFKKGGYYVRAVDTMSGPRFAYCDILRACGIKNKGSVSVTLEESLKLDTVKIELSGYDLSGTRRGLMKTIGKKDVFKLVHRSMCSKDVAMWIANEVVNVKFLESPLSNAEKDTGVPAINPKEAVEKVQPDMLMKKIDEMLLELLELKHTVLRSA